MQKVSYRFGEFALDPSARVLLRHNQPVEITAKVFETLALLVENRGRVLNKEDMLTALWPNIAVEEANLVQNISTLRKLLDDTPKAHRYIATIPGRGYSFVARIEEINSSDPIQTPAPVPPTHRRRVPFISLAAIALAVLAATIAYLPVWRPPKTLPFYSPVPLTGYVGQEISPSMSPGGERVAFAWDGPGRDNFDIYAQELGTRQPLRLTSEKEPDISPVWSPSGESIAFLHVVSPGKAEVSLISSIEPGPRRVLAPVSVESPEAFAMRFLCWSPDGKWLVVVDAPESYGVASLYLLSVETGEKRRLTFPPVGFDDLYPSFSADATALSFVRCSGMGASASELYLLRLSRNLTPVGPPERLTNFGKRVASPVWLANRQTILFARPEQSRTGQHSLWRIDVADPKGAEPLPIAEDASSALTVSRAGDKIVFTRETTNINIWAVELASHPHGQPVNFKPWITSTAKQENPQFSPNGQQIAYQSSRNGKVDIWVCNRDGSNSHQLTNVPATISGFARWSRDGQFIVFHARPTGDAALYVVGVQGGAPVALTTAEGNNETASWSHDGKWIYFVSRRSGNPRLYKMPAAGGPAIQLSNRSAFSPLESKDGRAVYFVTLPEFELWKLTVGGSVETRLVSDMAPGPAFAPAKDGIYYIRAAKSKANEELVFLRYSTGRVETISAIPAKSAMGMAISPDERLLLFSQVDQTDSDLMLVDRFH